jgi:putative DNA primase/helicase
MSDVNMLLAALAYIKAKLPVFPVHYPLAGGGCSCRNESCEKAGKHPITAHGCKDATTDPQIIEKWWTDWPDANIGLPTGGSSGLVVLDIDFRSGGLESLKALEKRKGALPATLESLTGNGLHLFYRCPEVLVKNRVGFLPGIDVRGEGGYVVVPPSLHANGRRYEWMRGEKDGGR